MFTVSKLSKMSRDGDDLGLSFESDVGKIQMNKDSGVAVFDMRVSVIVEYDLLCMRYVYLTPVDHFDLLM